MNIIAFLQRVLHYFSLENDIDSIDKIHDSIVKDISFKGTNLWILIFAIVVASVGLNMNSTAVIIGAMLISPLMGPINGMGYSIATYNFPLFRQAAKNFAFAVLTSLAASATYFALSPISTAHSELLARTSPTIYDVLIALFGGMAGIIAISSKQKGNVIPGVAIATALMPPLCTAGYGLATGQLEFFLGAFYLFTINTVFIAISSVLISQILKFPISSLIAESRRKRVNRIISGVIAIVSLPSIYFGYNLVQKEKFNEYAGQYISNVSVFEGNYLLNSKINANTKTISLVYGGMSINAEQKERIIEKALNFNLPKAKIEIEQGLSFDDIYNKNNETDNLKSELNKLKLAIKEKEVQLDSIVASKQKGQLLLNEIRMLYPQMYSCSYADTYTFSDSLAKPMPVTVIMLGANNVIPEPDKQKINAWLKIRLATPNVEVIYFENPVADN